MKRATTLFLTLIMLASLLTTAAYAEQTELVATAINNARGEGDLVVYTTDFGATTATNAWGAEAVIGADNKCISVGAKGDSAIPEGGFVLSGHDANDKSRLNKAALLAAVKVGSYVYFNDQTMVITVSDEPITSPQYYEVSVKYNSVNTTRYENQLIIFNRNGKSTATNEWGYEIVVTEGVVTSLGGNDNTVPQGKNSMVVSGHGDAAEWLRKNVVVGMSVTQDTAKKELLFVYNANSASAALLTEAEALVTKLENAKKLFRLIDIEKAEKAVAAVSAKASEVTKSFAENGDEKAFAAGQAECDELIATALALLEESRAVEYRGVWIRPSQTTAKAVDDYVQKLYETGINLLCIETLYDSCMIMPMPEDSLFEQNPRWKGFDMLQAYIDSCHKRGMELHIWLPTFYVGHSNGSNSALSVGTKKPEWLCKNNIGTNFPTDSTENNYFMLDPSNDEACAFLIDTYKWILQNYKIDGFELDYIRYWARGTEDWGYNEKIVAAFKEKTGITPKYDTDASWWKDWCDFRSDYVSEMVLRVRNLIDSVAPNVLLTAAVGADASHAKYTIYQDYESWLKDGLLDCLHPMCYGNGYNGRIEELNEMCGDRSLLAVGLGTYDSTISADEIYRQAVFTNDVGGNGSVYFEATSYFGKAMPKLLSALYANKALVPTDKDALGAVIAAEKKRVTDIILPSGAITESEASAMTGAYSAILAASDESARYAAAKECIAEAAKIKNADAKAALSDAARTISRLVYITADAKPADVSDIPDESSDDTASDDTSAPAEESSEMPSESSTAPVSEANQSGESADESIAESMTESKSEGGNDGNIGLVIGIIAGALVLIGAVVFIIIKKRK